MSRLLYHKGKYSLNPELVSVFRRLKRNRLPLPEIKTALFSLVYSIFYSLMPTVTYQLLQHLYLLMYSFFYLETHVGGSGIHLCLLEPRVVKCVSLNSWRHKLVEAYSHSFLSSTLDNKQPPSCLDCCTTKENTAWVQSWSRISGD